MTDHVTSDAAVTEEFQELTKMGNDYPKMLIRMVNVYLDDQTWRSGARRTHH